MFKRHNISFATPTEGTWMVMIYAGGQVTKHKDGSVTVDDLDELDLGSLPSPFTLASYWCLIHEVLPEHPELMDTFKQYGLRTELFRSSETLTNETKAFRESVLSCRDILPLLIGINGEIDADIEEVNND